MQWENVYIFISSTFNDMHAERDYLVKRVFPQLSAWCEERRLRLMDIDLRWGVSEADATQNKRVVQVCLDRIDECRPFFLCFLGQRRGWVPTDGDVNDETRRRFPKLDEKTDERNSYLGNNSVTEMEILHALIDPMHNGTFFDKTGKAKDGSKVEHAFFFLREPDYLKHLPHSDLHPDLEDIYTNKADPDPKTADKELNRWREVIIPATGRPRTHYTADWNLNESTPEIALPLFVPTTAPRDSDVWKKAFAGWKKRWAQAGVAVSNSGEITDSDDLKNAKLYNERLKKGRLGNFRRNDESIDKIIIKQLQDAITKRFGERVVERMTPLQKELDQQAQFLRIASEGFFERTGDFDALKAYLEKKSETRPFAVTAYAGMGKTSLLAHFIDTYSLGVGESLHYRFIGGSDDSVSVERLVRSLLSEIKEKGKLGSDIPVHSADMMNKLPDLLAEVGAKGKTILIIDALNQLESGMNDLYWIPSVLPEGIKLIVSFKLGEKSADEHCLRQKESGAMILHSVKPFDSLDDRKALVATYLEQYFKELDEPRIQALIGSAGADNPLFLKEVLTELRVFGAHNNLSEVISNRFGTTPVTAFKAILERIESDPAYSKFKPAAALPNIFGWIAHSRHGMRVEELVDLTIKENLTDNKMEAFEVIYLILRQLRSFLAKKDGRVDFFYESFKVAVIERYTNNHIYSRTSTEWHRSLAEYFETLPMGNQSKISQLAYQYYHASLSDKLSALLFDYACIKSKIEMFNIYELLEDFEYAFDRQIIIDNEDLKNLKSIRDALKLSMSELLRDKSQLAFQLYGRMADNLGNKAKRFFDSIAVKNTQPFLRPIFSCLPTPGAMICKLRGHTSRIHEIKSHEDAGIIASASDNEVILWASDKMKMLYLLPGNAWRISLSKDGKSIAILRKNGSIEIWNIKSRFQVAGFTTKNAVALDLSADGRYLAVIDTQERIYLCDISSGKSEIFQEGKVDVQEAEKVISRIEKRSRMNHFDLFFINNDKQLISHTGEVAILWDLQARRPLSKTDPGAKYSGRIVVAEKAGKAYINSSGTIYEWDYANNLSTRKYDIDLGFSFAMSVTPDGNTGVCINDNFEVLVIDLKLIKTTNILPRTTDYYQAIAISDSGNMVITGEGKDWGGTVITLWDPHEVVHLGKTQKSELSSELVACVMSGSGESIAVYSQFADNIIVLDVKEEAILEVPRNGNITCLAMNEAQGMLAAGCNDGVVTVWKDGDSNTYRNHLEKIKTIDIHPSGHLVATVSERGQFVVVDMRTGMPHNCEILFDSRILGARFTGESGEYITAYDEAGNVKTIAFRDLRDVSSCRFNTPTKYREIVSVREDRLAITFAPPRGYFGEIETLHIGNGKMFVVKEVAENKVPWAMSDQGVWTIKHWAISDDGSLAVTVDNENVVTAWDVGKQIKIAHFIWNDEITFVTCSNKTKTIFAFDKNASYIVAKILLY